MNQFFAAIGLGLAVLFGMTVWVAVSSPLWILLWAFDKKAAAAVMRAPLGLLRSGGAALGCALADAIRALWHSIRGTPPRNPHGRRRNP